jgi:hypothetical protein
MQVIPEKRGGKEAKEAKEIGFRGGVAASQMTSDIFPLTRDGQLSKTTSCSKRRRSQNLQALVISN